MIGEVVDGHEILRPLGAGGMGEVYVARGAGGALRALKIVRAEDIRKANGQDMARHILEAYVIQAYQQRELGTAQLRPLLGFETRYAFEDFLATHHVPQRAGGAARAAGTAWSPARRARGARPVPAHKAVYSSYRYPQALPCFCLSHFPQ